MKTFRSRWTLTTALGYLLGFWSFGLISTMFKLFAPESIAHIGPLDLPEHLDPNALPDWLDRSTYETLYTFNLSMHLVMYPIFGAVFASIQAFSLRDKLKGVTPWIIAAMLGFLIIIIGEVFQRHVVIGPHAGPIEPILLVLGGGGLAGVFQFLWLRSQDIRAAKWLGMWIAGILAGIVVAVALLMGLGKLISGAIAYLEENLPQISWAIEMGIFGSVVGAVAGWISGKALLESLQISDSDPYPVHHEN
jgi:hypothetical protein